ncbi:conserved membrane hypothetical protein [uncultured Thiomicrorhabdus sp.]
MFIFGWACNQILALGLNLSPTPVWFYWILVFPILEELVFRGWIQTSIKQWYAQRKYYFWFERLRLSQANIITSMLFASLHFALVPVWTVLFVFIPSLWFGWLKDRYQLLLPSMIFHAYFNALFLLFSLGVILQ